jgi:hypothetical protein
VDARFRAKLAEMAANGQTEQAEELRKYVEGLGGAAGDAARALVTGIPLTKEAANANLFANDAIRQNTLAIQEGKKATTAITETQQALADGTDRFGKQIMYAGDQFGGVAIQAYDAKAMIAEQNKLMEKGMTREQAIEAIQKKQMLASGKNTDQFVNAQLATANASKNLQSLGFSLAEAAIPAVEKFAEVLDDTTGFIAKKFGVGGSKVTRAGVDHGTPGGAQAIAAGKAAGGSQNAETAMKFFMSAGYTKEQAAGLVGNLQVESGKNLNTGAVGDGGKAKGIAQWHPDRQAKFQEIIGKDVMSSTLEEQLRFVDWELKNTEKSAGDKLRAAKTAAEAARIVDKQYERSSGEALGNRIASATALAGPTSRYSSDINSVNPTAAGVETKEQAQKSAVNQQATESAGSLSKQLAEFNQTQRDLLAVAKKQLVATNTR